MTVICLFGPNGSGKSSLARALARELERRGPEPRGRMDERHPHIYIQATFPKEISVLNTLSWWLVWALSGPRSY
jgi:ABC-type cobalamin/Fe3+-siderophores transport system ATPase subunit